MSQATITHCEKDGVDYIRKEYPELCHQELIEVSILTYLDHPNIIEFGMYSPTKHRIYTKRFGRDLTFISLTNTKEHIHFLFTQLLQALSYLHVNSIVHTDIKHDNILLCPDTMVVKLCDFGNATTNIKYLRGSNVSAPAYRAPECWDSNCELSCAVDCWSLGVVLYSLLNNDVELHNMNLWYKNYNSSVLDCTSEFGAYHNIVYKLLNPNPKLRLTALSALKLLGEKYVYYPMKPQLPKAILKLKTKLLIDDLIISYFTDTILIDKNIIRGSKIFYNTIHNVRIIAENVYGRLLTIDKSELSLQTLITACVWCGLLYTNCVSIKLSETDYTLVQDILSTIKYCVW